MSLHVIQIVVQEPASMGGRIVLLLNALPTKEGIVQTMELPAVASANKTIPYVLTIRDLEVVQR